MGNFLIIESLLINLAISKSWIEEKSQKGIRAWNWWQGGGHIVRPAGLEVRGCLKALDVDSGQGFKPLE